MHKILLFFFIFSSTCLFGQDEIFLFNPSFEGAPRLSKVPKGWQNCNAFGLTPVDMHPVPYNDFQVTAHPAHGRSYIGMVVREDNTIEAIGQELAHPIKAGRSYVFELFLARSPNYISGSSTNVRNKVNYNSPCKLRILGGDDFCDKKELLAESKLITKEEWISQQFIFQPTEDYSYLVFEIFYKDAKVSAYNGNLLLDGATTITEIKEDGSFFEESLYKQYLPSEDFYTDAPNTGNIYEDNDTSSPTLAVIRNLSEVDKAFYSEQMSYVIFRRGMTSLESEAIAALKAIATRLSESKEEKLRIRFKEDNRLLYRLRLQSIFEALTEGGLPEDRFSFGNQPDEKVLFSNGSRDVEMMIY